MKLSLQKHIGKQRMKEAIKNNKPKKQKKKKYKYEKPSCIPTYDPYKSKTISNKNTIKYTGETVYIYSKIQNPCTKNHPNNVEPICMLVDDLIVNKSYTISLFYCQECHKYFTHLSAIQGYIKSSRRPAIKYGLMDSGELRPQSLLNLYGYNAQKDGLSETGRRNILENIIDHKLMSKIEITNLLQHLVNFNGKSDRMLSAVQIWESDLKFISTYTKDTIKSVSGTYDGKDLRLRN